MSAIPAAVPNSVQIRPRVFLGEWTKFFIYLFIYLYFFSRKLTYRSDPSTDFHAWWLKRRGLARGCAFWGFRWYCSPKWEAISTKSATLCEWNSPLGEIPQTPNFWGRIGVNKSNVQNIESFILLKLFHRFKPNSAQRWRPSSSHRGWSQYAPNTRPTNPRWRTAAILKTVKSPYICNLLTDFHEIWHSDAFWSPAHDVQFKFVIFYNLMWRRTAILRIEKLLKYIL